MIEATLFPGEQGRLVLAPTDRNGAAVTLDADAVHVSEVRGTGTFDQNAADTVRGTVFRVGGNIGDSAEFDLLIDAHPGTGTSFLPETVKITRVPLDAISAGVSMTAEPDGTAP